MAPPAAAPVAGAGSAEPSSPNAAVSKKLGRYSAGDASVSLVLDRSTDTLKYRRDGQDAVVELTAEPFEQGGVDGQLLREPQGRAVLKLTTSGKLYWLGDGRELELQRDGDAEPLGKPTLAGRYVAAPSDHAKAMQFYESVRVVGQLKDLTPEDSANLERVRQAIREAKPEQFVVYAWSAPSGPRFRPAPTSIGGVNVGLDANEGYYRLVGEPKPGGLSKLGGQVDVFVEFGEEPRVRLQRSDAANPELLSGSVGLIWNIDGGTLVFVSLDGGRYETSFSGSDLQTKGGRPFVPLSEKQPAEPALQHALVSLPSLRFMAKAKAIDAREIATLEEQEQAFVTCAKERLAKGEAEVKKLETQEQPWHVLRARYAKIIERWETDAKRTCRKHVDSYEAQLTKITQARNAERAALLETSRERLRSLAKPR